MSCSQDSAFCVPVCGNSESAYEGPVQDHIKADGKKHRISYEQFSAFQPGQLQLDVDKSHAGATACTAGFADSNDFTEHGCGQSAINARHSTVSFQCVQHLAAGPCGFSSSG